MSEPTTEAGRELLARLGWFASEKGDALREGILAVEAEAADDEALDVERLALTLRLIHGDQVPLPRRPTPDEYAAIIAREYETVATMVASARPPRTT